MAGLLTRNTFKLGGCIGSLLGKQVKSVDSVCQIQVATLKATFSEPFDYHPKPFPYQKKALNLATEWIEGTKYRLNENSKIILVDGNVAVGKNEFGSRLAKAFNLKHYPSVKPDRVLVDNETNFDRRQLNDIVPQKCRFYDLKDFYSDTNPTSGRISRLQIYWFMKKYENYCSACLHLLSTGQGVVITSSPFSDVVYVEAMRKMGYITKNFHEWMLNVYNKAVYDLMPPHLSVYLDAPIQIIRNRINKRNDCNEVNSKVLNDKYVTMIQNAYKSTYLPTMKHYGETVQVDWTEVGDDLDMDTIAEELETLKLESADHKDTKFHEWRLYSEDDYAKFRRRYSSVGGVRESLLQKMPVACPEVFPYGEETEDFSHWYNNHPAFNEKSQWRHFLP